jgi:hypothetical protein
MEAADFSQMSIDMPQILGRQIPDDTTAIKKRAKTTSPENIPSFCRTYG